jgi:hypothetical protein
MEQLPSGFYVGESYCIPHGLAGDQFLVLPGPPRIELDGNGQPQAAVLQLPAGLQLSLQAAWSPDPDAQAALERAVAQRYPAVACPRLQQAPWHQVQAWLELGPPQAPVFSSAPQDASMTAPQRAGLSVFLPEAAQQEAVRAAMRGERDCMRVVYRGQFELCEEVQLAAAGDLAADLDQLAPRQGRHGLARLLGASGPPRGAGPDLAACLAQLQLALQAGRLTLRRQASPNASSALHRQAEDAVLHALAEQCSREMAAVGSRRDVPASYGVSWRESRSEQCVHSVQRALDCGAYF